jgi:superfamily I DNA/RNA helicase
MGARPSSFKSDASVEAVAVEAPAAGRVWSAQQQAIFDWFRTARVNVNTGTGCTSQPNFNLVVRARAGTGKTTTIIEGVNRAPEDFILVCAFNKKIAEELTSRITNPSAEAKTLHALGYQFIRRQWSRMGVSKGTDRADYLTKQAVPNDCPTQIRRLVTNLHTKARDMGVERTFEAFELLAMRFDLVPDDGWRQYDLTFVVKAALKAVEHAATVEPSAATGIDFADMIFLPLAWKLLSADYQMVVVDEAQDMTTAQLQMAQGVCSGRICIVGDDRQAIYGFRGADSGSLDRLKQELGAAELPLLTTYRCGQVIVREAQRLVPDIEAGPNNPEGVLDQLRYEDLYDSAQPTEFILSRINAPLVSITLGFIRRGKRARMAGRDIGAGIKAVIYKVAKDFTPVDDMLDKLQAWESKMVTRFANRGQLDLVDKCHDQCDTVRALAEDTDARNVGALVQTLGWLFEDNHDSNTIICSSVHKAKGLEADRVYVLAESLYRRPGSDQDQEEQNIEYVAITRAKSHLTWVCEVPGLKRREQR